MFDREIYVNHKMIMQASKKNGNPPQLLDIFVCPYCGGEKCYYHSPVLLYLPQVNGHKRGREDQISEIKIMVRKQRILAIVSATCQKCKREIPLLPIPQSRNDKIKRSVEVAFCQLHNWVREIYGEFAGIFFYRKELWLKAPDGRGETFLKTSVRCDRTARKVKKFIFLLRKQVEAKRSREKEVRIKNSILQQEQKLI
ncbi:MAG: hypothetical protein ACPLW9_01760 [Minisyncoccales bacterium]